MSSDGPAWERLERWAWGGLLLLSLALRLWDLGSRAYHHDESIHGWFSYDLAQKGEYIYDPIYHGPVQYFMVASTFRILGDSDFTARLPAALGGVGLVAMAMLLRARFGRGAAFASGVLLAVSPNILYFTRFCREDVWSLLGTFGLFLWLDRWWRTRRVADLGLAAVWGAVAFASKENFYVLGALMVPSILAAVWEPGKGFPAFAKIRSLLDVLERHGAAILGAIFLFFTLSEVAYTFFLVHPDSGNPAFIAISYWWGQHKVERVGGPKTFYLPRLLQYEFAIVLPALAWIGMKWRRFSPPSGSSRRWRSPPSSCTRTSGRRRPGSSSTSSCRSSRSPALPGRRSARRASARPRSPSRWASRPSWRRFRSPSGTRCSRPSHPRAESVVFTQTSPELMPVVADVVKFAATGADPAAAVFGEAVWPLSWYFRRLPIYWAIPNAEAGRRTSSSTTRRPTRPRRSSGATTSPARSRFAPGGFPRSPVRRSARRRGRSSPTCSRAGPGATTARRRIRSARRTSSS